MRADRPVQVEPLYPATHAQSAVPVPDTLHVPPFSQGETSHTLAEIVSMHTSGLQFCSLQIKFFVT